MTKVDLICDLQFGSTGKGLFAGYLGYTHEFTAAVSANMPNAGHTFVDGENKWVFKVLPIAAVALNVHDIFIGPGAVFDISQLKAELDVCPGIHGKAIFIHEGAVALRDRHAEIEQKTLNHISSTMQGSMAAMVEKMKRDPENDPRVWDFVIRSHNVHIVSQRNYHYALSRHHRILVEGSQGYSLGINAGFWPYCTSRDCTPARILADCGIPAQWLHHTYGVLRTFPIRVGNTDGGNSGPVYTDQAELTWEEIGQEPEMTTVTGRVRRVFTFSWEQYEDAWGECLPDGIFLNFVNYMEEPETFMSRVFQKHINWGGHFDQVYYGTGPDYADVRKWI